MTQHNLLKLVDVLRTISDENVSFDCMKVVLDESTSQHFDQIVPERKMVDSQQGDESTTSTVTSRSAKWKKMIKFAITSHYKNTQDFTCISNIHNTLKHFNKFGQSQSITIAPIPKPSVCTHSDTTTVNVDNHNDNDFTGGKMRMQEFVFTQKVFLIESIMINIFQYLNLNKLSLCRSVCQQWLYDASNPLSVYHVDTFYIRKILDHFINWTKIDKDSVEFSWDDFEKQKTKIRLNRDRPNVKIIQCDDLYVAQSNEYSNNLAKYNIELLKYCQSLTIDVNHFAYDNNDTFYSIAPQDILKPLSNVQKLKILLSQKFESSLLCLNLSHWFEINSEKSINSVELIITAVHLTESRCDAIEAILKDLSKININNNNNDHDPDHDTDTTKFKYLLNVEHLKICTRKYIYSCDEFINWFYDIDLSMIKCLEFSVMMDKCVKKNLQDDVMFLIYDYDNKNVSSIMYDHKHINYTDYFDTRSMHYKHKSYIYELEPCCSATTWKEMNNIICEWNQFIDLIQLNKTNNNMKIEGINLVMLIDWRKGNSWMHVGTDLSKSDKLVNLIQSLYKWYNNGNIGANLFFRVSHIIDERCVQNYALFKQVRSNQVLKKQGWIKLTIKALTSVFKCHSEWEKDDFYPFDLFTESQQYKQLKLLDRVTIKLFVPIWIDMTANIVETTFCVTIQPLAT